MTRKCLGLIGAVVIAALATGCFSKGTAAPASLRAVAPTTTSDPLITPSTTAAPDSTAAPDATTGPEDASPQATMAPPHSTAATLPVGTYGCFFLGSGLSSPQATSQIEIKPGRSYSQNGSTGTYTLSGDQITWIGGGLNTASTGFQTWYRPPGWVDQFGRPVATDTIDYKLPQYDYITRCQRAGD